MWLAVPLLALAGVAPKLTNPSFSDNGKIPHGRQVAGATASTAKTQDPPLKPKPYKIGIAPSHITAPTAPLFGSHVGEWAEVRENIDFYKIYSLQAVPPKWASQLPVDAFADTQVGLITNFPNWHYTADHPGMLGSWTKRTGVHYLDVLEAVHRATRAKGMAFDFVEVDCPWNYYRATANRDDPSRRVDNATKFKALQQWCRERDMEFWLVVNRDTNPQKVAGKVQMGNRLFHDGTLTYIRQLRRDGVFPDCFTIQSWYKLPDKHLPEGSGYSFMHAARDAIRLIRELFPEKDRTDAR
ncbi:MAG: hypothetical protein KAI66_10955 [Lentisphaeria bacterium]|nr:hypothetical protein [Lentisphaeria bacterium]